MNIELKIVKNNPIDDIKFHKLQRLLADDFPVALNSFVMQSQIYINAIRAAIDESRFQDAMGIAHKLKSSAGLYGFMHVSKFSNDIERSPMTCSAKTLLDLHAELDAAMQEATSAISWGRAAFSEKSQ